MKVVLRLFTLFSFSLFLLTACDSNNKASPDLSKSDFSIEDVEKLPDQNVDDQSSDKNLFDQTPADASVDTYFDPFELRIMAANLTSGNGQDYDPGHGQRIIKAFAPDIVLIQEFSYESSSDFEIETFISDTLGSGYDYVRENSSLPNGVISRYPIIDSGEWDDPEATNRDFVWARIDIPGKRDLWAISVHLLTKSSSARTDEAQALFKYIEANIPKTDFIVLGGDFNTDSRSEGCFSALRPRFIVTSPYPVDQDGNGNTNASRNAPYDWVLASPELNNYQVDLVIGANTFPDGLVFDSRIYTPLEDLPPVLIDDSDASQMQHMAVIKHYRITPN